MNVERVSYRDPKWNLRFRILEIITSILCMSIGILLHLKTDTKESIRLLVLIVGIFMTVLTIFDLFKNILRKPPHFSTKWLIAATIGMAFFYLSAGAVIVAQETDISLIITFTLTFTLLAATIFYLDILYILRNLRPRSEMNEISPVVKINQICPVPYKCPNCEQPCHHDDTIHVAVKSAATSKDIAIQINEPVICDSKICKRDKVISVCPYDIMYENAINESREATTIINVQPAPPQIYHCPKCSKGDCSTCNSFQQIPEPPPCPRCFKKGCTTCFMAHKIQEPPPQPPTPCPKYSTETFKICSIEIIPDKKVCTSQDILEEILVQKPPCNYPTSITEVKQESTSKLQMHNIFCPSCQRSCEEALIKEESLIRKSDIIFKRVNSVQFAKSCQAECMKPLPKAPSENKFGVCPHCKREIVEPKKDTCRNIVPAINSNKSLSSSSADSCVKENKKIKSKLQKRKKPSEQKMKKSKEKIHSKRSESKQEILDTTIGVCPHCELKILKPTEEKRPIHPCQDISNISFNVCPKCKKEKIDSPKDRRLSKYSQDIPASQSTISQMKEEKIEPQKEKRLSICSHEMLKTAPAVCPKCKKERLEPAEDKKPFETCQDTSDSAPEVCQCKPKKLEPCEEKPPICSQETLITVPKICQRCRKKKLETAEDNTQSDPCQDTSDSASEVCQCKPKKLEPCEEKPPICSQETLITVPKICERCRKKKLETAEDNKYSDPCQDTSDSSSEICQCKKEKLEIPKDKPLTCNCKISNIPQEICSHCKKGILEPTKDNRDLKSNQNISNITFGVCRNCKQEVLEPPENIEIQDSFCSTCIICNAKSTKHSQPCLLENQQNTIECEACKKYWKKHQCPICYQQCGKTSKDEIKLPSHCCPICQQKCTNIIHETKFGEDKSNEAIICGESDCKIQAPHFVKKESNQPEIYENRCPICQKTCTNIKHETKFGEDKSNETIICGASDCKINVPHFVKRESNVPEICENRDPLDASCTNPVCSCIAKSLTFYPCVKCNETICDKPNENREIPARIIDERRYSGPLTEKDPFEPNSSDEKEFYLKSVGKCSDEDCLLNDRKIKFNTQNRSDTSGRVTERGRLSSSSEQSTRHIDHDHKSRPNEYTYKHEQDKTEDDLSDASKISNNSLLSFKKFETYKAPAKKIEFRTPSTSSSSGSNKNMLRGKNLQQMASYVEISTVYPNSSDSQIISLKKLEDYAMSHSETNIPNIEINSSKLTSPKSDVSSTNLTVVYENPYESSLQSEVQDFWHGITSKQNNESSQKAPLSKIKTLPSFSPKSDESNTSEIVTISLQNRHKNSFEYFDNSTQSAKPITPLTTKSVTSKTESSSKSITPKSEDSISPANSITISELTFDSVTKSEKDYESQQSEKDNESLPKETQTDHVELNRFACEIIEIKNDKNYAEQFDVQEKESNEFPTENYSNNTEESQQLIIFDERDEIEIEQPNNINLPEDNEVAETTRENLKCDELTLSYKLSPSKVQSNNTIDSLMEGRVSLNDDTSSEKTSRTDKNLDDFPVIDWPKSISETILLENPETLETNDENKCISEKNSFGLLQSESKPTDVTYPIHESKIFTSIDNFEGVPSKLRIPNTTEQIILNDDNNIYTLMETPLEVINENEELSIHSRHEDVLRNEQKIREAIIQELMEMDEQYDKLQEGYEAIISSHELKVQESKSLTNSVDTLSKQSSLNLNKSNNSTVSSVDSKEVFSLTILTDSDDNELKAKKDSLPDIQHFPPENTVDSNLEPLDFDYQDDKFETFTNEDIADMQLDLIPSKSQHEINIESNVPSNHDDDKFENFTNEDISDFQVEKIQSTSQHNINIESNVPSNHDDQNLKSSSMEQNSEYLKIEELIEQYSDLLNSDRQKQTDEHLLSEDSPNQSSPNLESEPIENDNTLSEQLQIPECIDYNTMKLDDMIQQNKEYLESIGLDLNYSDIEDKPTDQQNYEKSDKLDVENSNFYSPKSEKSMKQDEQYAESVKSENLQLICSQNQDSGQSESDEAKNENLQLSDIDEFKTEDIQNSKLEKYSQQEIVKSAESIKKDKSDLYIDESCKENKENLETEQLVNTNIEPNLVTNEINPVEVIKNKSILKSNRPSSNSSYTNEILPKKDVHYSHEFFMDNSIKLEQLNNDRIKNIRTTNSSTFSLTDSDISSTSPYTSVYKQSYEPKDIFSVPTTVRQKINTRTAKSENDADTDNEIKSCPNVIEYAPPLVKQDTWSAPCTSRKIADPSRTFRSENDSKELIPSLVKSKFIKLNESPNEIQVLKGVLKNNLPLDTKLDHDTPVTGHKISYTPTSSRPISTRNIPVLIREEKTSSYKNILSAEDEYSLCESKTEQSLKIFATINKIVEQNENEVFIRYKVPNSEQYYYDANNKVLKEESIDIFDIEVLEVPFEMENNPAHRIQFPERKIVPPLSIASLSPELSDTDAQDCCYTSQKTAPRKNLQVSYPCSPKRTVCGESATITHEYNKHSSESYKQKSHYQSSCSTPGIKYVSTPAHCPNIEHEQLCYSSQFQNVPLKNTCPKSPRQECLSYRTPPATKCGTSRKTWSSESYGSNIRPVKKLTPCISTTPRPTVAESRFISNKTPTETKKRTPRLKSQEKVEFHSDSEANRKKSGMNYKTHSTIPKYTSMPTTVRNSQQENKRDKSPTPRRKSSPSRNLSS